MTESFATMREFSFRYVFCRLLKGIHPEAPLRPSPAPVLLLAFTGDLTSIGCH
jgi:hypothetical protein